MAYNVNPNSPDKIYRWIERKPLTEAVAWTIREQFYLIAAVSVYGSDWKSIAQIVKNAGEPYRPKEWYTQKNCERQLRIIVISQSREVQSMSVTEMLNYIYQNLLTDYERDLKRTTDINIAKCISLQGVMNRMKQGNLSRNEISSLYSQAKRHEIEGKQYMEQLRTRQNATLASENLTSGLSEEPIKWNAPSAPLLTSLLRSRSTISANRNTTPTSSQLQIPGSTSRTRSGKLLPLTTSSVRTTQGTPTLSKLLEAPANPYIPSPSQPVQKSKQGELIGTDKLVENTSKKENSQSPTLNKVRVDGLTPGPLNQLNKPDLSYSKRQMSRSPVSTVKNGSKASSSVVNLLSDSENEDDNKNCTQNTYPKNIIGEKKDTSGNTNRVEPRATRSQTRAEGGFKQFNDNKLSDEKKDRETPRHQSGTSQMTETQSIDDLIDIDQIEVEPLSTVQDEMLTSKVTRSSVQRLSVQNLTDNLLVNKSNNKEINNQMLEEISANFVLNSTVKNVASDYKNVMVGQSRIDNENNISGCLVPMDGSAIKDSLLPRKDGQCFSNSGNTLPTLDGKLLKQKRIIELKGANIKCIDSKNEKTVLSFANQPIVVVNKIKKPFNFKLTTEANDKGDNAQVTNYETKKGFRLQGSTQNLVQLLDSHSLSDEVIIIDDDVNINVDDKSTESSSKSDMQNKPIKAITCNENSNVLCNSISTSLQVDEKKTKNDKTLWNMFGKPQNLIDNSQKKVANQDGVTKSGTSSNIQYTNNRFIKELDFDFDQSNSLSDFYNGVEEIVEMHSFDNEELNSLIECGSLDNSETQERQNTVTLDKADCSVSECDSTIGAFDTFAQITRVPQKTISSKGNTIVSKEIKTIKDGKDLEHSGSFGHVEDIEDDQATASVTGIPVLQGVISDVMSKIDSDRVAALSKTIELQQVPINDIVEISSDEEGPEKSESETPLKVTELTTTQEYDKNTNVKKLTEDKLLTFDNPEITLIKDVNSEFETNTKSTDKSENISKEIASSTSKPEYINVTSNAIRKCVTNKIIEIGSNSQSKNEMELYEDSKKEIESKCVQRSEFIKNKKDEVECKKGVEINTQINEDKLKHDVIKNNKESDEKLLIERDEIIKTDENEKKIKTVEEKEDNTKEFEAQIIQKSKQNEEKYVKTAEIIKLKEPEIKKINDFELDKRTNTIINENKQPIKGRELRITKKSEIENQIDNGVEMQTRETEILKTKEVEEKDKSKDVERQHVDKAMIQKVREAEILKAKIVADIQRTKEVEARRLKDIEMKKEEEAEIQQANEIKEVEVLKTKEIDNKLKKTKAVLEAEILAKVKGIEYLVIQNIGDKETGIKKNVAETKCASEDIEEKLQKEKETSISEDLPKKSKKSEQSVLESRSIINEYGTKEFESEIIMSKEQELKSITENEVRTNKDVQIITRTRGSLKIEEKLKESNIISKNLFGRASESPSFTISITSSSDFQTSNYEYKNQAKNLFDENKRNNSSINSSALLDNNKDLSVDSNECISEVGGKSRTRSSLSFKQSKVMETKSSPCNRSNEEREPCIIPKATLGTETKITTSVDLKMSTNSDLQHSIDLSKNESPSSVLTDNRGKKLTVSVVMLNANDVPIPKDKGDQCTDIFIKHSEIKSTNNEHILCTGIDFKEKSDKPAPKKRGRKRRIDTPNLQQSNSDKLTHQNIAATAGLNTSLTNKIDPPAKRTRKSIVLHDNNISIEERNKKNLSYIYDNIYENNKLLSTFKKIIKDITSESCPVIKHPVELIEIKKKINSGEITKMSQLQINLLLISYNACMLNKSNSTIFAEITNFQSELLKNCQLTQCTADKDNELYQTKKNIDINKIVDDDGSDIYEEFDSSDVDSDNMGYETEDKDIVNENYFATAVALLKSIDNSSNYDSSDTESNGDMFKNKKNELFSDKSSDYEDSDSYNSNFD